MKKDFCKQSTFIVLMILIMMLSLGVSIFFGCKKVGFHYDEYYSYYSTNVTAGMWLGDGEYKSGEQIADEFRVLPGEPMNLGVVKESQSFDVHPPMYYYVLRLVCFLSKGTFSKWQGLFINLFFFIGNMIMLLLISKKITKNNQLISLFTVLIYGLSPAVVSCNMFIRMYSMLTFECLLLLYICVKSLEDKKYGWLNLFVPTCVLSFVGFMTHYYYSIFLFFVAAFMCLYMVFKKETRLKAFIFGGSVVAGMGIGVLYYPACISHIFSGYRGTEAKGAFFDMSNTVQRIKLFLGITNDLIFGSLFYFLALIVICLFLYLRFKKKSALKPSPALWLVIVVTLGYFLTVSKTALEFATAAESSRYQAPIFGLVILLTVGAVVYLTDNSFAKTFVSLLIMIVAVAFQIVSLCNDKVYFTYPDEATERNFASNHSSDAIVYIYNPGNSWMVWDNSYELMSYDKIFFVSIDNTDILSNPDLFDSDSVYIYTCRFDEVDNILSSMVDSNDRFSDYGLIEERQYVDIYEIK